MLSTSQRHWRSPLRSKHSHLLPPCTQTYLDPDFCSLFFTIQNPISPLNAGLHSFYLPRDSDALSLHSQLLPLCLLIPIIIYQAHLSFIFKGTFHSLPPFRLSPVLSSIRNFVKDLPSSSPFNYQTDSHGPGTTTALPCSNSPCHLA